MEPRMPFTKENFCTVLKNIVLTRDANTIENTLYWVFLVNRGEKNAKF